MPRRLGQHFLRPSAVSRLVDAIAPAPHDVFLEIGPGAGALTLPLAARAGRVVAVELDGQLASSLAARAPANVAVVPGDALALDLGALVPSGARLVGNLPYYISSPLLRRLVALHGQARDLHAMVQEEVADRVAAAPGGREYGVLSVLVQAFADVTVAMRLPPSAFDPPPRVRSAVLRAVLGVHPALAGLDLQRFERLVVTAFGQRRKTLANNLQDRYVNLKQNLKLLNIEGTRRAETLSVAEFAALSGLLEPR